MVLESSVSMQDAIYKLQSASCNLGSSADAHGAMAPVIGVKEI